MRLARRYVRRRMLLPLQCASSIEEILMARPADALALGRPAARGGGDRARGRALRLGRSSSGRRRKGARLPARWRLRFGPLAEQWRGSLLARRTGVAIVVVDYRRAPEHPFPAAFDDANAVIDSPVTDGVLRDGCWAVAGDSAGGGLAVATTMRARDEGLPLPDRLLLMSPWLDVTIADPAVEHIEDRDPMLWIDGVRAAGIAYAWGSDPTLPSISPLYGDAEGLPPILMQGGEAELLAPDQRTFAKRCSDAGVDVTYEEYRGAFHVFPVALQLPEARRALRRQFHFLEAVGVAPQRGSHATA